MDKNALLHQLQALLVHKKSKSYYAKKLGISEDKVMELLKELKKSQPDNDFLAGITASDEDVSKGKKEVIFNTKTEITNLEELIKGCNIDVSIWNIDRYVQNYWGSGNSPHWQVKAWLSKKKEEHLFQDSFVKFLDSYKPSSPKIKLKQRTDSLKNACLIINKQDAHYNKYDIDGENDIEERFEKVIDKTLIILNQAALSNNLSEIHYIIGSDEFNSEFTNATTKGTPQKNIHTYHDSFELICDHEVEMINKLLYYGEQVNVTYVAGNHDEFVGWHLVNWLATYFRNEDRVIFDCSPSYRKYLSYGNSAVMFNHGDAIKPSKLASIFPIEYKEEWSNHNNFYIFTGDKHHQLSEDFNGITFYQLPAFSTAKGLWEDKNGHVGAKPEMTGFLIDEIDGMTNIFKQYF